MLHSSTHRKEHQAERDVSPGRDVNLIFRRLIKPQRTLIKDVNGCLKFCRLIMSTLIVPTLIGLSILRGIWFLSSLTQTVIFSPPSKIVPLINRGLNFMDLNFPYFVLIVSLPMYRTYMLNTSLSKKRSKGILSPALYFSKSIFLE